MSNLIQKRIKAVDKLFKAISSKGRKDHNSKTATFYTKMVNEALARPEPTIETLYVATSNVITALLSDAYPSLNISDDEMEHLDVCAQLFGVLFESMVQDPDELAVYLPAFDITLSQVSDIVKKKSSTSLTTVKAKVDPQPDALAPTHYTIPSEILTYTDEFVISQDDVKKSVATYLATHLNMTVNGDFNLAMNHPSLLITGPSGTGKTYIVKTMAEYLKVPFIEVDITQYSTTGYKGRDLEEIITQVVLEGSKGYTPILFIDEIDKIFNQLEFTAGLQAGLLKLSDGATFGDSVRPCIIFGGSFSFLREKEGHGKTKVGFGQEASSTFQVIDHRSLINFGMLPELVGRIGNIVSTEPLSRDSLLLLLRAKHGVQEYYDKLFKANGIEDSVSEDDLLEIIEKTDLANNKIGARGLKITAEKHFRNRLFR